QVDPETDKPYKKFYDPRKYLRLAEQNMIARLNEAFEDLRSKGKSLAL
ncbi:MAG TPA: class II fructose-bisphosphate aldolase, partial [Candidatus Competibacteraceae bacterium]|nr:class II fructose-bisphosphate aldolase [Candidatus Competibacteraceae bacterium]